MSGSAISTTITSTVTLGSGYASPLTVTSTGDIAPTAYGAYGVYGSTSSGLLTLINDGIIAGSAGSVGIAGTLGGVGGIGVDLNAGAVTNDGTISGGAGGYASRLGIGVSNGRYHGDNGGVGVDLACSGQTGTLTNDGAISGGSGGNVNGYGYFIYGGIGGSGVYLYSANLANYGTITGGTGGHSVDIGGAGGNGVDLSSGTLTNGGSAAIIGGIGCDGQGRGGAGGIGVSLNSGTLTNEGTIAGGYGGTGNDSFIVRTGGNGVYLRSGTMINIRSATIAGGNGGYGSHDGGEGGNSVYLTSGTVINYGTMIGGAGGNGSYNGAAGGNGVYLMHDATLGIGVVTNDGTILGGAGGNGSHDAGHGGNGVNLFGGTLNNDGIIIGGNAGYGSSLGAQGGLGVFLAFGSVTNDGTIIGGASGYGSPYGGQGLHVLDGNVTNNGVIAGGNSAYGGVYEGPGTLTNAGTITGGAGRPGSGGFGGDGVVLKDSPTVTNDGTITGGAGADALALGNGYHGGIGVNVIDGFVFNFGTIAGGGGGSTTNDYGGAGGDGIDLMSNGWISTLTNHGAVSGGNGGSGNYGGRGGTGVYLHSANLASDGIITGGMGSSGFLGGNGGNGVDLISGTITNSGTIIGGAGGNSNSFYFGARGGNGGAGVSLGSGIVIDSGTIAGGSYGAGFWSPGTAGDAVQFGTAVGTLVVDPGAVFIGAVVADSTIADVLELAAGSSSGTISGIGTQFTGFQQIGVDASATWTLTASNSIATYTTLTDSGTLVDVGSVTNSGLIIGTGGTPGNTAIVINGGSLDNSTTGTIEGGPGINFSSGHLPSDGGLGADLTSSTLTNSGLVTGGAGGSNGIYAGAGGDGLHLNAGSLDNSGTIIGGAGGSGNHGGTGGAGAYLLAGTLTNSGSIGGGKGGNGYALGADGGVGVSLTSGTLITSGTISGGAGGALLGPSGSSGTMGDAVQFGTGVGTLVVDPGAVFVGNVVANSSYADVLEFGAGTVAGTLTGVGTQFLNFNDFSFASGAAFYVSGTYTAFDNNQVISGFSLGDTLVLDGFAANTASVSTIYANGTTALELTNGTNSVTLDFAGSFATSDFTVVDPPAVTTISLNGTAPCFAAGTRILLRHGEVPVEKLAEGDEVILASGGTAPIRWIGHRRLNLSRHPKPETVLPVLISADAIMDGVPRRDLYVSPDHALFLGGCLIPAKALINGTTIRQVERRSVTYYHVELPEHAVLYADGVPAESYLETGNRGAFANTSEATILHPDFAQTLREETGCAPFAEAGPVVEVVRARILARAAIETTNDAQLMIRTSKDGSAVIKSRSAIPGHLTPDPRDCRRLGVKIATLNIGGADIPLDHPALVEGWHDVEADGRWTDGAAVIPASLLQGREPAVTLAGTLNYPVAERKATKSASRGA